MPDIIIVLDNLRSCHNVGSIIRTANGFNIYDFIFIGTSPYPLLKHDQRLPDQSLKQTRQISKTSLGAELKIKGQYYSSTDQYLNSGNASNLVCLEQTDKSQPLSEFKPQQPITLVLGNEVEGISENILKQADYHIMIPMLGNKESFNVAVACGIALYHFARY